MAITYQWDEDPPVTGQPNSGEDSNAYPQEPADYEVTVTHEGTGESLNLDFSVPFDMSGGATLTPDVTTVDSTGDEAARTITVAGSGFEANGTGTLELVPGAPGEAGTAVVTANIATDAQGAFTDVMLVVPQDQVEGDYHLVATVGASSSDNTAITVTGGAGELPVVTPDVDQVEAGGTVTLSGTGFPADTEGIAELVPGAPGEAGTPVASVEFTTDAQGAFTGAALVVPAGTADGGYHVVTTVGSVIADDTAITVGAAEGPVTTPDVTEVEAGGTVTVAGTGYPADTDGTVALLPGAPGSGGTAVVSADITTDAQGAFTGAALVVPAGTADGEYHLVTTVGEVVSDDTAITVGAAAEPVTTPDVTEVDGTGDEAARTITVAGTGFPAETAGTVELVAGAPGETGTALASADVTTDADGAFTGAAVVVPQDQAAGDYHLVTTVGEVVSDDTAITVTGAVAEPVTTPDVTEGAPGDTVTVAGTGFPAETAGTVELVPGAPGEAGTAVVSADVTTDAEGAFTGAALVVPAETAAGDYHLVATVGEVVSDDTAFTVTAAPEPPAIVAEPTAIDSTGDEAARTITVNGTGFEPGYAGFVRLSTGAPGSGGTEVLSENIQVGTDGVLPETPLIVPANQAAGDYHIVGDFGETQSDDTLITVTEGPAAASTRSAASTAKKRKK